MLEYNIVSPADMCDAPTDVRFGAESDRESGALSHFKMKLFVA
jgi:hypothetical protein